ncbi:MAG TPA: ATP-binding protein [Candidatus Polarisedimenticolaceae bacterium]|nr:ATP-binding protein [Candidatus Polarisedimenticolaceae bacterium]
MARLSRFGVQVRLVPAVVVLLLACMAAVHLALLEQARDALTGAERARTELLARGAVRALPPEAATTWSASALRTLAQQSGLTRLTLLDRSGRRRAGSDGAPSGAVHRLEREVLSAGRAVGVGLDPARGGEGAVYVVHVPLLDPSGKLQGVLEAARAAPELGTLEARVRLLWGLESTSVLVLIAASVLFANWVSRPWRRLAAAVGERETADPDSLAAAFRNVADKLREQEEALDSLGGGAAGLSDLARFAGGAAAGMTTGVLVVDREGDVAAANPAALALLGASRHEVRGQPLERLASQVPALADLVRSCLDTGKGLSREVLETRRPEGETGHLGVALSPAPGGALVLMTDLTEIREVQAQARLRENLAAVGQLSAGIAHEFRNALSTILGWARMLDKHDDPRVRGPAREIVREIDSVRGTVDEFLLYARPPEPARADVDVEELLRACAGALPGLAVEIGGSFGLVVADEGLLRRAFGNLLQNAKDMGDEVGRAVSVRVTGRVVSSGRWLQIDVEDDGPGIPPERRSQVFLPFFTTRARGTGLGLALVQRTLVDAGGSIDAAEGPQGGALFRVRLPRKGPVTKRDDSSGAAEPRALPRPLSEK